MMTVLASASLFLSSVSLLFMVRFYIKHIGYTPLPILVASFVLLDSLGLVVLPYLERLPLPYLREATSAYALAGVEWDVVYLRHVSTHLLVHALFFLLITFMWLFVAKRLAIGKTKAVETCALRKVTPALGILLLFLSAFFYMKYFLMGPGLTLLLNFKISFDSAEEAVQARSLAASQVEFGQGAYGASLATYLAWPFLAALAVIGLYRFRLLQFLVIGGAFLLSLIYALQTYQKAPIAYVSLVYGSMVALVGERLNRGVVSARGRKFLGRAALLGVLLGFIAGTALYVVNFGLSLGQAIIAALGRVFIVPANTEAYWFIVYPNKEDFLGLPWAFNTNMEIINRTAFLATGDVFSANASFVAVGWAGLGFVGVLLGSLVLLGYLAYVEAKWERLCLKARLLALIFLVASLFFLLSGTLFDWLSRGGLGVALLLLATRRRTQNLKEEGAVE
jgi:hypothetical protein